MASPAKVQEWLLLGAKVLGFLAFAYAIYWIIDKLASSGALNSLVGGAGKVATTAGTALSDVSDVTTASTEQILGVLGFDFSSVDPTTIPGYAVGNWNKLLGMGSADPLSTGYVQASSASITKPGPSQVQRWADALYDEMHQSPWYALPGVNPNFNKILAIYQTIPDQDNVNLVYQNAKNNHNFDLATDINGMLVTFTQEFLDLIATFILNKPQSTQS